MKRLIAYFFQGLLVVFPLSATFYILYNSVTWFNELIDLGFPGLGIIAILVGITFIGWLFSTLLGDAVLELFDKFISRVPIIKLIYNPLKDLIEALVGDKKKFNEPVAVELTPDGILMLGFVTRHDLEHIDLPGQAAVYFPFSYTFTGHVLIVPKNKIKPIKTNASEMMKFMVSGGITGAE